MKTTKNVRNQNPDLFMASFDIDSLFTNVPIDETIDISIKKLFGRKKKYNGFSKEQFQKLLGFAVKNSFFLFDGKYYEQVEQSCPFGPNSLMNLFKKLDKLRTGRTTPLSSTSSDTLLECDYFMSIDKQYHYYLHTNTGFFK